MHVGSTLNPFIFRGLQSGIRTIATETQSSVKLHYRPYQYIGRDTEQSGSQRPISASEFHDAFHSIWRKPVACDSQYKKCTLGIAVSGGVDSMALVKLCLSLKTVHRYSSNVKIDFHAFIVDHCARPSSRIEAQGIEQYLESLEIPCTILTLRWPDGVYPIQLPNFETVARRMRYQALGSACRDREIKSLLVAHHRDDQAETMLLRIAQGRRATGLKGIQPVAEFPDCWGIYGVHQSGMKGLDGPNPSTKPVKEGGSLSTLVSQQEEFKNHAGSALSFEDGGIIIYRPLLGFNKARVEATCRHWDVTWIEDETNSNPKLTSRNAIRHVLKNFKLPYELQKESLLRLQERIQRKTLNRLNAAAELLKKCNIIFMDTRSGGLVIRFISRIRDKSFIFDQDPSRYEANMQYVAALLLRRVIEIVTPQETVSLQGLEFAVNAIFPDIGDPLSTTADKALGASKFTAANVSFVRIDSPISSTQDIGSHNMLDPQFAWVLTRQPIPSGSKIPPILINPQPSSVENPSSLSVPPLPSTSKFHLWDGRFWLQIYNPLSSPLVICHLCPADLISLRASLPRPDFEPLNELIREAAPGKIRYTLPVVLELNQRAALTIVTEGKEHYGEAEAPRGKVLALPTLGWCSEEAKVKGLVWEARYKKVNWGDIGRDGCTIV